MPGVVHVFTGADLDELWANPMPCAWPVTEDMKNPPHYPLAISTVNYVGDGVAAVVARSETEARDALDAVDVDYDVAPRGGRPGGRAQRRGGGPRRPRHQHVLPLGAAPRRRRGRGGVRERRARGEGALRPAAAHADGHGAPGLPGRPPALRRRHHAVHRHADPPHPQGDDGRDARDPRAPDPRRRPVGRWRLRLQAQRLRRGAARHRPGLQAEGAGPLRRGAHRERARHHPRPRPDPAHGAGRRRRRQGHRGAGRAARRHGGLPPAGHAGHPAARRLPLRAASTTCPPTSSAAPASSPP